MEMSSSSLSLSWERSGAVGGHEDGLESERVASRRGGGGGGGAAGEELLVFGYSCKLFNDEAKARDIDQGKHLIPWMGSEAEALLIDRFDVRGYLHDLTLYESKGGLKDIVDKQTEDEIQLEILCDSERFADLQSEQNDFHEEELKRFRAALAGDGAYHAIGYEYGADTSTTEENVATGDAPVEANGNEKLNAKPKELDDFRLPPNLNVPEGTKLPRSMKEHNLMEKTAAFISKHGVQMEIIVKTKQSSNSNFNFLAFDSELNGYYKHLVAVIKSGKYVPKDSEQESGSDSEDDSGDEHYLHPSLLGGSRISTQPITIPSMPRGLNENDSYALLVQSLKNKMPVEEEVAEVKEKVEKENLEKELQVEHKVEKVAAVVSPQAIPQQTQHNRWSSLLPPPPAEVDQIIEKLAQYVAKNGEEFEATIRRRGEERFEFLNPGNKYHAHYIRRKLHYFEEKRKAQAIELKLKASAEGEGDKQKASVSFSLASKDKRVLSQSEGDFISTKAGADEKTSSSKSTTESEPRKQNLALADKLAAAARERLSREKQLQEERKRKAALFLSMIKSKQKQRDDSNEAAVAEEIKIEPTYGPNLPVRSRSLSPMPEAVTSPGSFGEPAKDRSPLLLTKCNSLLPFVARDEPLKESSRHSHRHHHHHHNDKHRRSHKSTKSRHRSRTSRSRSRSRSKSVSRKRTKHSRSRSRSRSRSKSRSHKER